MTTTTLDKPAAAVTKSSKKNRPVASPSPARGLTAPAPKKELPAELKAATDAFAKDVKKGKPAKAAVKKLEKAATVADKVRAAKVTAPKAKAEPKPRKVSAMQVIRKTLAHNHSATVEEIGKACAAAGVPKADGTILTIRSDFMQTLLALREAGCLKA